MDRINIKTSESPEVHFTKVKGSLRIKGWDRHELLADSDEADAMKIKSSDNSVEAECKSGCMIRMPVDSSLKIDQVDKELMLKSIECSIEVGQVAGQIMAKSIGSINIEKASSNLIARNVEGNLACKQVTGNANLQDIDGNINLEKVNGNLVIKGFTSGINADTNGNATLRIDPETGGEISINSKGNISCRLSPDTNATIHLFSNSNQINVKIPGTSESLQKNEHQLTIGEGVSQITLKANGVIDLKIHAQDKADWSYEFDLGEDISLVAGDISQIVSEQIETQLESLSSNLSNLSNNLTNLGPLASEKSRKKLEAKRIQLERKLARVERRASGKAIRANRRAVAATRRFSRQKAASDPVSDSERQKVLEMLQNQQISVQEAEILLAALEGRDPEISGDSGKAERNSAK